MTSELTARLAELWEWFADEQCRGYSPLYDRICRSVARDGEVLELVRAAPPPAHMPTVLLGAVHYLLLAGLEHPLAEVYAGRSDADPAPLFLDVCRDAPGTDWRTSSPPGTPRPTTAAAAR